MKGVITVKGYQKRYDEALKGDLKSVESNGCLMRISPLSVMFVNSPHFISQDCCLTNPSVLCQDICMTYCQALYQLIHGVDPSQIYDHIKATTQEPTLVAVYRDIDQGQQRDVKPNKGWIVHSFYCAMFALASLRSNVAYNHLIDQIIGWGGDTDTNAAIAGAVIGAYLGNKKLSTDPKFKGNWQVLLDADTSKGNYPRDECYHPKQIPALATALSRLA